MRTMPQIWSRLLMLALFGIAGIMAWQFNERIYEDKGRLNVFQDGDAVVMSWSTTVELPMARRFYEAFNEWQDRTGRIIVELDSPGGSLWEGREVIKVIDHMKKTHQVDTRVRARRKCLSMCVPIFLQGQRRIGAVNSVWMFHEPRSVDFFSGRDVKEPESERRRTAVRFFERYFTNSPMDPVWRSRLQQAWQGREIWRTGQQLVAERSNIITVLE